MIEPSLARLKDLHDEFNELQEGAIEPVNLLLFESCNGQTFPYSEVFSSIVSSDLSRLQRCLDRHIGRLRMSAIKEDVDSHIISVYEEEQSLARSARPQTRIEITPILWCAVFTEG